MVEAFSVQDFQRWNSYESEDEELLDNPIVDSIRDRQSLKFINSNNNNNSRKSPESIPEDIESYSESNSSNEDKDEDGNSDYENHEANINSNGRSTKESSVAFAEKTNVKNTNDIKQRKECVETLHKYKTK
jgi:hypothetical protein